MGGWMAHLIYRGIKSRITVVMQIESRVTYLKYGKKNTNNTEFYNLQNYLSEVEETLRCSNKHKMREFITSRT